MKFIYKLLILGAVYLISNVTNAQIQQYSDDGTTSCIDCEEKSNGSKNCTCDFIEDYDVAFTIYARLEAQRQAAWLNERQTAIKEELDKRYNTTFNNFADAQRALFTDMVKAFDESKSIVEAVKNDASFDLQNDSREFRKYFYEKGALRQRLNEIGDGVNADLSVVGDLKTDGKLIKNMSSIDLNNRLMTIGGNETNTFNLIERNGRILDGLPKIGNTSISDTKIINAYIDNYNSKNVENKVRAMLKYMIRNNLGSPFNNSWYVDDTNLFHPTRSYLAREYSDLAYHQGEYTYPTESISDEERINRYAISQFGNQALDLILSTPHLKLRVGDYLKYHRYEESTMNFATDIFKHYGDGRFHNFPHNQYDYSLDDGSLYSIDLQDEQNKNRLFLMHNHNAGRTRKFNGLGNVLSGLAALEGADRDEAFIGDFALEILKDNGYDMSTMFTGQQAFDLFSFRTTTYGNLGRYDLRIDIGKFRGEYLWDNNIRFPSYIGDLIARDAILAYAANDHPRFEHLVRVRSVAEVLGLNNKEKAALIAFQDFTEIIYDYLALNNNSAEAIDIAKKAIKIKAYDDDEIILFADCASWEYANQSDGTKACGITGITNLFLAIRNGGLSPAQVIQTAPIYFTMPRTMTNGRAATISAATYDGATKLTELWALATPGLSDDQILIRWKENLSAAFKAVGGSISGNNTHNVFRTAPFVRSFVPTNCD
ncbi:hypothetical protein [Aquimarina algiphila]|uniref:Uncharacterized protein n=1 Tax=Aquimarina algiphila TaxID=2047982 RepID=A0A554VKA2_9FLAO|nr:hypothetical protein [Aquimarina algiphila]TSE08413.1 hypothetical protein FOF46_12720 [Aquimarina algiphila]